MKQFENLIKEAYKTLTEQVPAQVPDTQQGGPATPEIPAGDATAPAPEEAQPEPESNVEKMTPEGEVSLIRLLVKALVIKPKPEDTTEILALGDINETNAKEQLKKIIGIIRRYSQDVDIGNA